MSTGDPRTKRVLVVDDEITLVELITDALTDSAMALETRAATSGHEGCVQIGEFEPDLVILDVHMPGIDGTEVLRSIKNSARATETKVLVTTGMPESMKEMRSLGCDDCITKPFGIDELLRKVESLIEPKAGQGTNEATASRNQGKDKNHGRG